MRKAGLACALSVFLPVFAASAPPQDADSIRVVERRTIELAPAGAKVGGTTHVLSPTLAYFQGSGWSPEAILLAIAQTSSVLAQCGVLIGRVEMIAVDAPRPYRWFHAQLSRQVARVLQLAKPTVYFVIDTRQRPAFDAEAIGRANSRSRPELADTVWVTRGTPDLGVALAHEFAHVLMDDGAHSDETDNLMRDDTAPENIHLSMAQCAQLRDTASANGLLRPLGPATHNRGRP